MVARRKPAAAPAKVVAAKPAPQSAAGSSVEIAEAYREIAVGDGVMRVEAGDAVITIGDSVTVMPPAVYAAHLADTAE